ncbi:MAG TPA: DUF6351 family protein [Burkholderiaceae bacterium]|nr:DUF6351 family protein [Burkholderiaceae bacterium]
MTLSIDSLSSRPDMVSGGDVLLRVRAPAGKDLAKISVRLNGQDVTARFRPQGASDLVGLIDRSAGGLELGPGQNAIAAYYDGAKGGELALTNHPLSGPMFSGPHETPFVCETASFALPGIGRVADLPGGSALRTPSSDGNCAVADRVYHYFYWSSTQRFVRTATPGQLPADATTTDDGTPFVVRVETGTINRAVYQIAMLHDPSRDPEPSPFDQPSGWKRKLAYTFGGGCSPGWHRQGNKAGWMSWYRDSSGTIQRWGAESVLDSDLLRRGFAVASSTLNVFGQNCNEVTAAETMAMVKERFIEAYGVPRFTIGWGCSGGAYQEYQIADNYPGLLDGIVVGCSYPEVSFTAAHFVTDARLMNRYFAGTYYSVPSYTDVQKRAISGLVGLATLRRMDEEAAGRVTPYNCPDVLSPELRYHPVDNPGGARCGLFDHTVNVWGTKPNPVNPAYTIAMRPLDNEGVQYGLKALNEGVITVDQFLDLNEKIGGFDSDGTPTAAARAARAPRSVADAATLPRAYRSGRMLYGGWGLRDIPVIDYRLYEDNSAEGTYHLRHHSFITLERLRKANGSTANYVMLVEGSAPWTFTSESPLVRHALDRMDEWLSDIAADTSGAPARDKALNHKPSSLREGCVPPGAQFPSFVAQTLESDSGSCASSYPVGIGTRAAAGEPAAADIAKCQLKPVATALSDGTYQVSFNTAQRNRLTALFASGVCDWSKPGVGQPSAVEYQSLRPWQSFD